VRTLQGEAMPIRNSLLSAVRRFAAGIDVSQREVRLAVLSRSVGPVRVECLAAVPLAAGAMAGAEIVDRAAVASALIEALSQLPPACAKHPLHCAMAVPGSATTTASVALSQLMARPLGGAPLRTLAGIEPAVLAHAERVAGIERNALAVDWFIDEAPYGAPPRVTIAATARQHLEARVEAAAAAGVALAAIDGEPPAALRAMRHGAELELNSREQYAAIWIGADGVYGWRIANESIEAHMRYPAPEHADLADALRALAGGGAPGCALICGDIDLLGGVGFSAADVADLLGCTVLPFECAAFCDGSHAISAECLHAPTLAVAFGLALRGVFE
jgi:Tfp pilus assembly PilM family ATPase